MTTQTKTAQHTPGPWTYDSLWSLVMAGKAEIAAIHCALTFGELRRRKRIDEARANARLIAAAPDLLAALKDLVSVVPLEFVSAKGRFRQPKSKRLSLASWNMNNRPIGQTGRR